MATSDLNETACERTGERLLRSSATMTYDPIVDIDWGHHRRTVAGRSRVATGAGS